MAGLRIAVVGMACRGPGGVQNPDDLWNLVRRGEVTASDLPEGRWADYEDVDPETSQILRNTVRKGNFMQDVKGFDARFFQVPPAEAEAMDPQQRMMVELAWEGLERAGIPVLSLAGTNTGVFVGTCTEDYGRRLLEDLPGVGPWTGIGAANCALANRVSYLLDLRGPSLSTDTACSASLVAIHLAARSLRDGDCDLALAGGINLLLSPGETVSLDVAGALSPDGRCRPFDVAANGYGRGEGGAILVLKRLEDAEADHDSIYAIIQGTAVQQDGRTEGIMAPSGRAQEAVMRRACDVAAISPEAVGYVEAHGTGTRLGDPEEVAAITAVYASAGRNADDPCYIGSVKSNIGHLEGAAGVMGVIKSINALTNRTLPKTVVNELNPNIEWNTNLRVSLAEQPWAAGNSDRYAAVSSFGYGGTVAHVVLQERPSDVARTATHRQDDYQDLANPLAAAVLVPISARSDEALRLIARALAEHLEEAQPPLIDLAHELAHHRSHLTHRAVILARSTKELAEGLRDLADKRVNQRVTVGQTRHPSPLVWVFSGHGSHWEGMGRELLGTEPAFTDAVEKLAPIYRDEFDIDLPETLRTASPEHPWPVDVAQVMIYAIQVGLAHAWKAAGYEPAAVLGHSVGEIAAAVTAGVMTLETGGKLICRRSRLLREVEGKGAMRLLYLPASECMPAVESLDGLDIAIHSSTQSTVISGDPQAIERLDEWCRQSDVTARKVDSTVAFHGRQMAGLAQRLELAVQDLEFGKESTPIFQTAHDNAIPPIEMDGAYEMTPIYWAGNLRNSVYLREAVTAAFNSGHRHFLEVSGHPVVSHSINETAADEIGGEAVILWTLTREATSSDAFLNAVARAHCLGHSPDWSKILPPASLDRRSYNVPTTKWLHKDFWVPSRPRPASSAGHDPESHNLLGEAIDVVGTDTRVWTTTLTHQTRPYPGTHSLSGVEIVPAAVLVQTILDAHGAETNFELRDLQFLSPLFTTPAQRVQVARLGQAVTIASQTVDPSSREWIEVAVANCAALPTNDFPTISERRLERGEAGSIRGRLQEVGVPDTGFSWEVDELFRGDGMIEVTVSAFDSLASLFDALTSVAPAIYPGKPELRVMSTAQLVDINARAVRALIEEAKDSGSHALAVIQVEIQHDDNLTAVVSAADGFPLVFISGLRYERLEVPDAVEIEDESPLGGDAMADLYNLEPGSQRAGALESLMRLEIAARLGLEPDEVSPTEALNELGLNSVMASVVRASLERQLKYKLPPTLFWKHPTVRQAAQFVDSVWETPHLSQAN